MTSLSQLRGCAVHWSTVALAYFRAAAGSFLVVLSACVLGLALAISYFISTPAIGRWRDLITYMTHGSVTAASEDEQLAQRLTKAIGADAAIDRNVRVLSGFTNIDLGDANVAAVQADELGNTPPGGDLYWIPRTGSVSDAYGLLLATLIDERKDELVLDHTIQTALKRYLATSTKKQTLKSARVGVHTNVIEPPTAKPERDTETEVRAAASLLRQRLGKISVQDQLVKDFVQYIGLADTEVEPVASLPELRSLTREKIGPLEQIVAGELIVTTFDASGTTKTEPLHVSATIFGRQPRLIRFQRPSWFKYQWIALGRQKAASSNAFASFFGARGDLADIPDSLFVEREPIYILQVAQQDANKLAGVLADNNASVVVQYPGGKIIAPASAAQRMPNGLYWELRPTQVKVAAVALVSKAY